MGNKVIQTALILEDIVDVNAWIKQMLLETFEGIRIQQAYSLDEAKHLLMSQHYDLALIDLSLPDGKGIEVIDWLVQYSAETISVVVTIFEDDQYLFEAISHGAKGYLLKDLEPVVFKKHLENLIAGLYAFSPTMTQKLLNYVKTQEQLNQKKQQLIESLALTNREKQVLIHIAKGQQVSEIAYELGLSSHTVSGYVKEIYRKLQISSRAEAALLAKQYGLI
ncbi:response regulator [Acinetobacter modestus]|jgi:DNA-binding NarL/FixJ family response regulator|uniref:response regulator n=1 Tax=Acinetobacter modestus TaxID=1776740 RepID=UPI001F4B21F2|nr:response regulator transcription factor [Acinetobacter modestus]MCH7331608.1 response regulator transcription factor [Acinetobacter modestus]